MKFKFLFLTVLFSILPLTSMAGVIEDGCVYRFTNHYNSRVISVASAGTDLMGSPSNPDDHCQWWYAIPSGGKGSYFRNIKSGAYMKCSADGAWSAVTVESPDDNTMAIEVLQTKTFGKPEQFGDDYYVLRVRDRQGPYQYAHTNTSTNLISWTWDAGASQWGVSKVNLTAEELAALLEKMEKAGDEIAGLDRYQQALDNLFEDAACTVLKPGITLGGNPDYEALPPTLKRMADKVQSGNWDERCGDKDWDSRYAKKYRIQNYEPYSEGNAGASLARIQAYTNMNNPTGILTKTDDVLYIMVGSEIPEGATLYINGAPDEGMYNSVKSGLKLHRGLNAIMGYDDKSLMYVYYTVETVSNGKPARKLENYSPITIHIEGGTLNGFFNYVGDSLYEADKAEDFKYTSERALHPMYDLIGKYVILHFHLNDVENPDDASKPYKGVRSSLDPVRNPNKYRYDPVEIMKAWDKMCLNERVLMGIERDENIDRNYYDPILGDDYTKTVGETTYVSDPGFRYSDYFNNRMMGISMIGSLYMNATSWRTAYNVNTISYVLNEFYGDGLWGPAHEYGHMNQGPINMAGTTEVSNNIFSNVATYFSDRYEGSRADYLSSELEAFYAGKKYLEYGTFNTTRMFWQLWSYYHGAGHNKKFYPRLFELLRKYPLRKNTVGDSSTGGLHYEKNDMMHFALMCCVAAEEDLTNFFTAWGFFREMDHYLIDDYSQYIAMLSAEDISETKNKIKSLGFKANDAILFIDDRIGMKNHAGAGEMGSFNDYMNGGRTPDGDFGYTVTGTTVTVTSRGDDGVGFIITDNEGNLLGFSNSHTFTVPEEVASALMEGSAFIDAVGSDESQSRVRATNIVNDGSVDDKKNMLAALVDECKRHFGYIDPDKRRVGYYLPEKCEGLQQLCGEAEDLLDAESPSGQTLTAMIKALHEALDNFVSDQTTRIAFEQGATYRIQNNYPGNNGRSITAGEEKSTAPYAVGEGSFAQQWFIDNTDGDLYTFKNYETDTYLGAVGTTTYMTDQPVELAIIPIANKVGVYGIAMPENIRNGLHVNGSSNIITYLLSAEGSQWIFVKVNDREYVELRNSLIDLKAEAESKLKEAGETVAPESVPVALDENCLYSNASYTATNNVDKFTSWKVLLDNDLSTYWHSDYSNKDSSDGLHHYIRIMAPGETTFRHFTLSYVTRATDGNATRFTAIQLDVSPDLETWNTVYVATSGLPVGGGVTNVLPEITVPDDTKYIRFMVTNGPAWFGGHPIFSLAEIKVSNRGDDYYCTPDEKYGQLKPEDMSAVAIALANSKESYSSENSTYDNLSDRYEELANAYNNLVSKMSGTPTGMEGTWCDPANDCEYYNLQGIKVTKPEKGIYIQKQADKTTKIIK